MNAREKMNDCEAKAWMCLATLDFKGFGRQAEVWSEGNKRLKRQRVNPFKAIVAIAVKHLPKETEQKDIFGTGGK